MQTFDMKGEKRKQPFSRSFLGLIFWPRTPPYTLNQERKQKGRGGAPRRDFCSSFSHFPLPFPSRCGARDWAQCLACVGKGSCRFAAPSALGFILNQDLKQTDVLRLSPTHRLTIQWEKKQWSFSGYKYFKNFLRVCVHVCVCVSVQKRPLCVCPSTEKVILSPLLWVLCQAPTGTSHCRIPPKLQKIQRSLVNWMTYMWNVLKVKSQINRPANAGILWMFNMRFLYMNKSP